MHMGKKTVQNFVPFSTPFERINDVIVCLQFVLLTRFHLIGPPRSKYLKVSAKSDTLLNYFFLFFKVFYIKKK